MPSISGDSFARRYAAWISKRPLIVLGAGFIVFVASALVASHLQLRTAVHELLPTKDPGVVTLLRTQERMGNLTPLLIGVRSPDPAANERYAALVTQKLRELPKSVCESANYNIRDVKDFFAQNRWLYLHEPDLIEIRDRLRQEITKRKNPLLVDLSDDSDDDNQALRARITQQQDRVGARFPDGLFASADRTYLWIAALPPGGLFVERGGESLYEAAQAIVRSIDATAFHPQMKVEVAGPVVSALATRQAVERDILWVTVTCLVLVAISIGLYFRRLRAVPLVGIPAVTGTIMAFAVAEVVYGYLNSSTAFLGSIIVGNGINCAIVLMARYEEERAKGNDPVTALASAMAGVFSGTAVAAICASAAYASLILTSFRGFSQFGVMGAAGVIFCWLATFALLPALLMLLDRGRQVSTVAARPFSLQPLARLVARHSGLMLVLSVVWTCAAIFGLRHFLSAPFEYDFRKLNAKLETTETKKEFNQSLDKLFGRWPYPTVVLADRVEEVEPIRRALRRQDAATGQLAVVGEVVTVFDILPGPPDEQTRKLAVIGDVRKLLNDPLLKTLSDAERKSLGVVEAPGPLRLLEPSDLPPLARRPFTEVDGTIGRPVLLYAPESRFSMWSGNDLLRMANVVQYLKLTEVNKTIETSGSAVVFGSMLRSILHDGPRATAASFLGVVILMLLTMRPLGTAVPAIFTLVLGVAWMVGGAGLAQVKITFLNFIALPITFGIGAEYALNVMSRYRQSGDMTQAVASTGSAVTLCSWTTIIGYGSLLAASNQALNGFGAMAILGELSCLLAAVVSMPAFFMWRARRAAARAS